MIDLKNTKIDCTNKNGKVNESINHAYIKACEKQGIKLNISLGNATSASYLYATSEFSPECGIEYSGKGSEKYFLRSKEKQITLADIKPKKTKVEFVKVDKNKENGAYWECARDFANGVDFYTDGNVDLFVSSNDHLLANYKADLLYRKVETEITWQEELEHYISTCSQIDGLSEISTAYYEGLPEHKIENEAWNNEFIEMCRVVIAAVDGK